MKASQIEVSLGPWTEMPSNMIGVEVTLGNKWDKVGKIIDGKLVNGMLMATLEIDAEAQGLVRELITHDPCLLRPKIEVDLPEIEVNLQSMPAEVNMVAPENRRKG